MQFKLSLKIYVKPDAYRPNTWYGMNIIQDWHWSRPDYTDTQLSRVFSSYLDYRRSVFYSGYAAAYANVTIPDDFRENAHSGDRIVGWLIALRDNELFSGESLQVIRCNDLFREHLRLAEDGRAAILADPTITPKFRVPA